MNPWISLVLSFVASLALTPAVRFCARKTGRTASPRADRWSRRPVALMGGISIFLAFALALAPAFGALGSYTLYFAAIALVFVLGLVDDLHTLSPPQKLLVQIIAAAILVGGGFRIDVLGSLPIDLALSFLWIVGITNAFNLLDHMDGVSSGVAAIAGLTLMLIYGVQGLTLEAAIAGSIAGASLGFLVFNRHPATIFMGDSGSLFLGASLAALSISPAASAARGLLGALFVPVLILLVPILDTALVVITRLGSGRSVAQGGTDHTTHRLVVMGLSERAAAATLWAFTLLGGVGAFLISRFAPGWPLVIIVLFLFCLLLTAAHLARLKVYDSAEAPITRGAVLFSNLLHKKRIAEVLFDVAVSSVTVFGALFLVGISWEAFDRWGIIPATAAVTAAKALAFNVLGLYHERWKDFSLSDLPRYGRAFLAAAVLSAPAIYLGMSGSGAWVRVAIVDLMLTANLILLSRVSERILLGWGVRLRSSGCAGLIYGAGDRGETLARLLARGRPFRCQVVGFLDDGSTPFRRLHSHPILGPGSVLAAVLARQRISDVFIACELAEEVEAQVERECQKYGVRLTRFHWDFKSSADPVMTSVSERMTETARTLVNGSLSEMA